MVCVDCGKESTRYRFYPDLNVELCENCVDKAARNHVVVVLQFKKVKKGEIQAIRVK